MSFEVEAASCRKAQTNWAQQSVQDRLRFIREVRDRLVRSADSLCAAVEADVKRPAAELLGTDLLPTAAALKYLKRRGAAILAPRTIARRDRPLWLFGTRDIVYRRPLGVVGIIGTWNYPILLNAVQIAHALVAGNGVLWKPSEQTPRTAESLQELFAGLPAGLLQVLPATRDGGSQLAEAEIDHVVFTGSDVVGRRLAARLGERLVSSTLELSGSDAMLVLDDANLELAARSAWFGVTLNRGQTCIAVRRILVARKHYAEFVAKLQGLLAHARPVSLQTVGQFDQARRLIAEAGTLGATSLHGDALPTFLIDATPDMAICREACFAPLAAVMPFDSVDEAVRIANASSFGLAASIFSNDARAAEQLALRIRAGNVIINDALISTAHPATPLGGSGASGWGVTQGAEGLLAMTIPQTVSLHRGTMRPHVDDAIRPEPSTRDILQGLLRATHARGLMERVRGVRQMWKGIRKR